MFMLSVVFFQFPIEGRKEVEQESSFVAKFGGEQIIII